MSNVEIAVLTKSYGAVEILKKVDLSLKSGEFIVFVGPSGCGKSTLLRCISGLEETSSGSLKIDGVEMRDIPPAKRDVAMVFQSYALYPQMTVFDNMAYALKIAKMPKDQIRRRVEQVAERLHLANYLERLPRALSGGQRQRVAIGRAIVRSPKVFLFDEPLSNLDAALRVQMRMEIVQLKRELANTTMIYVTHDQVEAMTMADRIVIMSDGRIQQVGTPKELYESPSNVFVAGFIGSPRMNFLEGERAKDFGAPTIGVRPEDIALSSSDSAWKGRVVHLEWLGADANVYVKLPDETPVTVRLVGKTDVAVGSEIGLLPHRSHIHRFDAAGMAI
jgi:multiple sugar transport system ATP-binding protein